jgi:acetyl esterase/lipase
MSLDCAAKSTVQQGAASSSSRLMTAEELTAIPTNAPDRRIAYGADTSQYGELRVPPGDGPHPLVILVHGGCFKAAYAAAPSIGAMADALKADGIATWSIEYRRLGENGGGWPGTYRDVGVAVDYVRTLATSYHLDLGHVAIVGHSAGGHLAMWAAARSRLPTSSALYMADPLPARGVVDLAGPLDLTANIRGYEQLCRDTVITSLLGGTPASVPERYADASPLTLLPLGIPQVIVLGTAEEFVPLPFVEAYRQAATRAGDPVRVIVISGIGHFEIASPRSSTWPQVEAAIRSVLSGRLP